MVFQCASNACFLVEIAGVALGGCFLSRIGGLEEMPSRGRWKAQSGLWLKEESMQVYADAAYRSDAVSEESPFGVSARGRCRYFS
ncbi:MAG: hypothetical protein ACJAWL_002563 [Motiliproteus sp.]|jgi:hypothetical protein